MHVIDAKSAVGGACKTEKPFEKAPNLRQSTGAYLLGLVPPEIIEILDLDIKYLRRDPHYFLPTTRDAYLLFSSDTASTEEQFKRFFSASDWHANNALIEEIAALRDDVARTWVRGCSCRCCRPPNKGFFLSRKKSMSVPEAQPQHQ